MNIKNIFRHIFLLIFIASISLLFLNCSSVYDEARAPIFEWKYSTNYYIISSPAVDSSGNIYFGSQDKHVYALNSAGELIWKKRLRSKINSSPTIFKNKLYIGSQDTNLYVLNLLDGKILNKYKTGDSIHSSVAIDQFGNIYFGSYDNFFYALNPNMTLKWKYKTNGIINSNPAIDSLGNIYIGSTDGNLYAFNESSNKPLWIFSTQDKIAASPSIGKDNIIYIGSFDDNLYAINPDGTEKWRFKTDNDITSSVAITENNFIIFGSLDKKLYAIAENGTLLWSKKFKGQISSSPAISKNNFIFIGSYDNHLYMVRAKDGSIIWTYNLNDFIISSPSLSKDGHLYVTSMDYSLYTFKIKYTGYTPSPWPGLSAGNTHTGIVRQNLAHNILPTFQIKRTDTAQIKSISQKTNQVSTKSDTSVIYPRSKVISSIQTETESFVYTYNLDYQSTNIELITMNNTNGKILNSKVIDTPLINYTTPIVFHDINTINIGNSNLFLGLSSSKPTGISASQINEKGDIEQQDYISDTLLYEINDPIDMADITINGTTYIYVLGHEDHGLSAFQIQALGNTKNTLRNILNIDNVENYNYALDSPNQIITATIYNTPFLFVSSAVESGVSVFRINSNGTLKLIDSVFDIENKNFLIKNINSMALLSGVNTMHLVTASSVENGISVFSISEQGNLDYVDNIKFSETDFDIQQLGYISSINIEDAYYLIVYEQSQSFSNIFTINDKYQLSKFINNKNFETALINTANITNISNNNSLLVFAKEDELSLYTVDHNY